MKRDPKKNSLAISLQMSHIIMTILKPAITSRSWGPFTQMSVGTAQAKQHSASSELLSKVHADTQAYPNAFFLNLSNCVCA